MWCSQCGNEVPENARFCDKCGNKIEVSTVEANPVRRFPIGILAGIGVAVVLLIILSAIILGSVGKGKGGSEAGQGWIGYKAELEQGKHVKIAQYAEYFFEFDMAGRLVYAEVGSVEDDEWKQIEKMLEGTVPIEVELAFDESVEGDFLFEKTIALTAFRENHYSYKEAFENTVEWKRDNYRDFMYTFSLEDGLVSQKKVRNDDAEGNFGKGDWGSEYTYFFNKNRQLTKVTYEDNKTVIEYDDKGRPCYVRKTKADEEQFVIDITYNDKGQVVEKRWRGKEYFVGMDLGTKEKYYRYGYDAEGRMISVKNNAYQKTRTYDEEGRLLLEKEISEEGVNYEESFVYDEQGNVTKTRKVYDEGIHKTTLVNQYDKEEKPILEQEYAIYGGKPYLTKQTEYQYNKKGERSASKVSSYSYEANSDFSIVNQTGASEGEWEKTENGKDKNYVWEITYYTDEEWEQYLHDKEFTAL